MTMQPSIWTRKHTWTRRTALVFGVAATACMAHAEPVPHYHVARRLAVAGVTGWDYLTLDPVERRLYITDNKGVLVFDIDTLKPVGRAPVDSNLRSVGFVHGVAIARVLHRGYVTIERPATITAFDLASRKRLFVTPVAPGPDAIAFDGLTGRVFSFNAKQPPIHNASVVDAMSGKWLANVPLPGRPEGATTDGKGSLYANIADKNEIVRIDTHSLRVTATWPIANCKEPSPLTIDDTHRVLFAACDNHRVVMIDANTGQQRGWVHSNGSADAIAFDPAFNYVFAANGEGNLTIAHESAEGRTLELVASVPTAPQARTMALDPVTHRLLLIAGKFGPPQKPTAANPHGYPAAIQSSVELIILAP